jgi:hypothetical protein
VQSESIRRRKKIKKRPKVCREFSSCIFREKWEAAYSTDEKFLILKIGVSLL